MPNQAKIKRHGVEYMSDGSSSKNVGADMQHYSDLLYDSSNNIKKAIQLTDISGIPKITSTINVAYQNARWIAADLDKYVRAVFESEGVNVLELPINKISVYVVASTKALAKFPEEFMNKTMTLAAIKKQIKGLVTPLTDILDQFSDHYDMYAGMVSLVTDGVDKSSDDLTEISELVDVTKKALDPFRNRRDDVREPTRYGNANWKYDSKNKAPVSDIVFKLEDKLKKYGDPDSDQYIKNATIAGAIQSYLVAAKRLHGSDGSKFWSLLDPVAISLERLDNAI